MKARSSSLGLLPHQRLEVSFWALLMRVSVLFRAAFLLLPPDSILPSEYFHQTNHTNHCYLHFSSLLYELYGNVILKVSRLRVTLVASETGRRNYRICRRRQPSLSLEMA